MRIPFGRRKDITAPAPAREAGAASEGLLQEDTREATETADSPDATSDVTRPEPAPRPRTKPVDTASEQQRRFGRKGAGTPSAPASPRAGKGAKAAGANGTATKAARAARPRRPNRVALLVSAWWDRLISAVYSGSLSNETEQYAAHNTAQDYLWNSVGLGAWGVVFPILSIVTTQLMSVDAAGRFSMAFVTGTLLLFIANYGVRTFQVSDIDETHSFADYQVNRAITCAAMLGVGYLYCLWRGYDGQMMTLSLGMLVYRAVDGLADVYEGRLQQVDKLYLAGISQAIRSGAVIVAYAVLIFLTRDLGIAGIAMAVGAIASFVLLTLPLT